MKGPVPKLAVAVFCERVLQEVDGVLSVIRIIDRATVVRPKGDGRKPVIETNLVLSFRSDGFVGKKRLSLRGVNPDGTPWKVPVVEAEIGWEQPDHIANVTVRLTLAVENEGQHAINVELDGHVVSRIPLTVVWTTPENQTESGKALQKDREAKNH